MASALAVAFSPPIPNPNVNSSGLFELGGAQSADILGDGFPATGPDWAPAPSGGDGIFDGSGNAIFPLPAGGIAASFVMDDLSQKGPLDRTTFSGAGGSNKNNDPIPDWHWDSGNTPAKDDLSNTYAYAVVQFVGGTPHLIIYAGFERLDPSGDSHIDVEFFQDDVGLDEPIPCNDPGPDVTPCSFTGTRTVGDIIVSMDFLNGGGFGTLAIHEWMGPAPGYVLIATINGEGCNPADTICGFNNGGLIDGGPWPNYDRHGNEITQLPQNSFTEVGVDMTALEGATPCISTIMGKTRSSGSFTAELKDFSGPVPMAICGAEIDITPDGVNEVGQQHTFTVFVNESVAGQKKPAPDGTIVTVNLTSSNGASAQLISDTCATGTVDGKCTVTFTSQTPGIVTGHASADVTLGVGVTIHVETDGEGPNSSDAVKHYVDAYITINPPVDTNSIQESHTFTVTAKDNAGDGNGYVNVPDGTIVTVTLTDSNGASAQLISDTCATGTVSGQCTVTFTSPTAGTVTGHASVTLLIVGHTVVRETDGQGSNTGDAVKYFVAGSLAWQKVDNAARLLGGATFQVCRTYNYNSNTGTYVDVPDVCVSVVDDTDGVVGPGLDQDPNAGKFLLTGLVLGRYTVQESAAPPGYQKDADTVTVDLSIANPNGVIAEAFVNNRPIVKITAFGYTNQPTGTPTDGVVTGKTVYTFKVKNFGAAPATLGGSLAVTFPSGTESYFACSGAGVVDCAIDLTGIGIAAGAELTFSLTVDYTNAPDGTAVTASLNVTYDLNGLTRTASGSPAMIVFTIQAD